MNNLRVCGDAILQNDSLEVMAQGVQCRCENAEMGGDAGHQAKRDPAVVKPVFKAGVKKGGKTRFGEPQVFGYPVQILDDLGARRSCQGVG